MKDVRKNDYAVWIKMKNKQINNKTINVYRLFQGERYLLFQSGGRL